MTVRARTDSDHRMLLEGARRTVGGLGTTLLVLVAACRSSSPPPATGCDPGFDGPGCTQLTALPTPVSGALSDPATSFWDGSAIQGDDGRWHLFASRFVN